MSEVQPATDEQVSEEQKLRVIMESISNLAMTRGDGARSERILGTIEALARDALGQNHGVWERRLGKDQPSEVRNLVNF